MHVHVNVCIKGAGIGECAKRRAGGDVEDLKNWSQRPQRALSCQLQAASAHQAITKNNWHEKPKRPAVMLGPQAKAQPQKD